MMNTSQKINVLVEGTKGNVSIVNNEIFSIGNFNTVFVLKKPASNNKNLQDISSSIQQAATSEAKGLSLAMIAYYSAMGLTGVGRVYAGR